MIARQGKWVRVTALSPYHAAPTAANTTACLRRWPGLECGRRLDGGLESIRVRVRTVIRRLVWVAMVGLLGYGGAVVGASFFQTRQVVDEAVFEAGRRPRAAAAVGQATDSTLLEFAADAREAILVAARRNNLPIDPSKLMVKPEGSGIRVSLHWSYVLLEVADETALAVPLWLERTFALSP